MRYSVLQLNEYTHIDNNHTSVFSSDDRYECIAYIKAKDNLNRITKSKDKYYLFTRLDVIPDGELDTYVSNEDVYKSIE